MPVVDAPLYHPPIAPHNPIALLLLLLPTGTIIKTSRKIIRPVNRLLNPSAPPPSVLLCGIQQGCKEGRRLSASVPPHPSPRPRPTPPRPTLDMPSLSSSFSLVKAPKNRNPKSWMQQLGGRRLRCERLPCGRQRSRKGAGKASLPASVTTTYPKRNPRNENLETKP